MLPFITVFGRRIALYGILTVAGAALGICAAAYLSRRRGLKRQDIFFASLYALIGMLIGGKFLFIITILPGLIARKAELYFGSGLLSSLLCGGFVFYGGLLGGAVSVRLYCRRYKLPLLAMFDSLAPGLALAHAVGRIGCFFAGCCFGIEYQGAMAVKINGVARFPVQLLESALLFALSGFLLVFTRKERAEGSAAGLYTAIYPAARFCLEFLRGDKLRGSFLALSTSQWISLVLLPLGLHLIFRQKEQCLKISALQRRKNMIE